jgi:hypothetical protein
VVPALPADQLAEITLDERAKCLTLESLPVADSGGDEPQTALYVEPGCRTLTAKYEESFFIWGEKKANRSGVGATPDPVLNVAAAAVNSESHDYETTKPIRFNFDAKAGFKYWVTASFTGDQFLPRLVELDARGEAVRQFLPDQACGRN